MNISGKTISICLAAALLVCGCLLAGCSNTSGSSESATAAHTLSSTAENTSTGSTSPFEHVDDTAVTLAAAPPLPGAAQAPSNRNEASIFDVYELPSFDTARGQCNPFSPYADSFEWEPNYARSAYDGSIESTMQSFSRLSALGYDLDSFAYPEREYADLKNSVLEELSGVRKDLSSMREITFKGHLASELNHVLAENPGCCAKIESERVEADVPIAIPSNTRIVGNGTLVVSGGATTAVEARNASCFSVEGISIDDPAFAVGIHVDASNRFVISGVSVKSTSEKTIAMTRGCSSFEVSNCSMRSNAKGGLFLNGECSRAFIANNDISYNQGTWNNEAGLVLGSFKMRDETGVLMDFWEPDQSEIVESPHDIIVESNDLLSNGGQGIYAYAVYRCYIVNNTMFSNSKEGMCLDYASFGCYVKGNSLVSNGERQGVADGEPETNKLPGISLDNACYNIVRGNRIAENGGSGVKAVRASWRNLVVDNDISSNNRGQNVAAHFFGVEWASDLKPDYPGAGGLDFAPCFNNITAANRITGGHFSGVYLAEDAWGNAFISNSVSGEDKYAFELHTAQDNYYENNVYNGYVFDNGLVG